MELVKPATHLQLAVRNLKGSPAQARRKFLRYFPDGFHDPKYLDWERGYKWEAHERWQTELGQGTHRALIDVGEYAEVAARAVRIESRTNLLFSFEKMALRDAVREPEGAQAFAEGLYELLYGHDDLPARFEHWCDVVANLPRRQTRVLTWPLATVFGFIAQPETHFFLKPNVTRTGARAYGHDLPYGLRPSWPRYAALLDFAETLRDDLADLRPRDMIYLQSFVWVLGSDEYPD